MKLPLVSILIPVYNVRNFVLRCLNSVVAQTFAGPIECIIVDDCGTDNSVEIVKKFISEYNGAIEFRIVHHEHNRGLAAARNTAVDAAAGDFVVHLDSDDWLEPTAIEHLLELQMNTGADIVSGHAICHFETHDELLKEPQYANNKDMVYSTIQMNLNHVIWRRLIKRSLYIENEIHAVEGVNVGEDHYTMPRLAYYAKSIATLDEVVYHYNCFNLGSYTAIGSLCVNMKRYNNDKQSITILEDFFMDKDKICMERLKEIRQSFFDERLASSLLFFDRSAYGVICADIGKVPHFPYDCVCYFISHCKSAVALYLKYFTRKFLGDANYRALKMKFRRKKNVCKD